MARFKIDIRAHVVDSSGSPWPDADLLADRANAMMQALIDLGATDPFVYADLDNAAVEFSLVVDGEGEIDALVRAASLVRSAIQASAAGVPGWERAFRNLRPIAEEIQAA